MKLEVSPDATPIRAEDLADLKPDLKNMDELNQFEQRNILLAEQWIPTSRTLKRNFPSPESLKLLHKKMFDLTWKWAGEFRRKELSIGIEWPKVSVEVKKLCDEVQGWIEYKSYPWDELAARFHHRLVFIHPFVNGNGRHARSATNLLLSQHGMEPFSWGSAALEGADHVRKAYVTALKAADKGQLAELLQFVRS